MTDILSELQARGLVALSTDEDALRKALTEESVRFYVGFDPTAPSLHMGNLVQILTAKRLQDAGHQPFALVGGATGLIGDPRMSGERTLNERDVVDGWVESIRGQIERFLDFEGPNAAQMVNNLDWTGGLSALDFLRDVGKHFSVNRMLAKETVATRLNSEHGISFTEFSYQILQGNDFLELHRRHGITMQTGGSDQWGNLTSGTDLIRRVEQRTVHAMATPLITKADGTKFGKTESGTIWLDPELMSPYAFYQSWIQAEDAKVGEYLKQFTFLPVEEIDALMVEHDRRPGARAAQRRLAAELTTLVHGEAETKAAELASSALFGRGELSDLPESTLAAALREAGAVDVPRGTSLVDAMIASGLVDSKSAARRAIGEGGAYVNNSRVEDAELELSDEHLLHGTWVVLRRGKRSVSGVRVS